MKDWYSLGVALRVHYEEELSFARTAVLFFRSHDSTRTSYKRSRNRPHRREYNDGGLTCSSIGLTQHLMPRGA